MARIGAELPLEAVPANYAGEVAKRYRYLDGSGEIGVITSVTQPFCGDCGRLRLSADGQIFGCLFARVGTDLRTLLRSSADDAPLAAHAARLLARARGSLFGASHDGPAQSTAARNVVSRRLTITMALARSVPGSCFSER